MTEMPRCGCPACKNGRLEPFTIDHFRVWAYELVLDSGRRWKLDKFQADYVSDLFEFTRGEVPADAWLVVPEGNGKTTLVAGLALYYLEHTENASIPVAASSRDQTKPLFSQAEGFIVRTERLRQGAPNYHEQAKGKKYREVPRFDAQEGYRRIKLNRGGEIQIYAADEGTADGVIPRGLMIVDELHRHASLRLYRLWLGKGEKTGAAMAVISTAGEPGSEFEEIRDELRRGDVIEREGCFVRSLSETSVLHEWSVPEDGNVEDLALVTEANPLTTITKAKIERKRRKKSWTLAHWRRFTCNLATRSVSAAITEAEWHAATSEERIPEGETIDLGLDVGWKVDTTAIVPIWVPEPTHRLFGPAIIFEPPRDGSQTDVYLIERALTETHERNPIGRVVMDTTRAADVAAWIESEIGAEVIARGQTNTLKAEDYERFLEALRRGWLKHSGDPGLRSHVLNAIARTLPGGQTIFDRPNLSRRGSEAQQRVRWIDALVAAAMVHSVATADVIDDDKEILVSWV